MIKDFKGLIFIFLFVLFTNGWHAGLGFIKNIFYTIFSLFGMLDQVSLATSGDHITTLMFQTTVTFLIVGIVLEVINAPRGRIGSILGKALFWLIGFPVSFVLNIIFNLIF